MSGRERLVDVTTAEKRSAIARFISTCALGMYVFRFTKAQKKTQRTLRQNNFWWGICYPAIAQGMRDEWGENKSDEQVHGYCKAEFLSSPIVNRNTGEEKGITIGSTRSLNVTEGIEYTKQLLKLAADLGVYVDVPDEYQEFCGGAPVHRAAAPNEELAHA